MQSLIGLFVYTYQEITYGIRNMIDISLPSYLNIECDWGGKAKMPVGMTDWKKKSRNKKLYKSKIKNSASLTSVDKCVNNKLRKIPKAWLKQAKAMTYGLVFIQQSIFSDWDDSERYDMRAGHRFKRLFDNIWYYRWADININME